MTTIELHSDLEARDLVQAINAREKELTTHMSKMGGGQGLKQCESEMTRLSIAKKKLEKVARKHFSTYDKYCNGYT